MSTLTVRNVKDTTKQGLRFRAARRGVSVEQEVRDILDATVEGGMEEGRQKAKPETEESLYAAIRRLVEPHGGFELTIPERGPAREPPKFD